MLTPIVDEHERSETYPEGCSPSSAAGLLSLAQPEEWGGAGQPFEVYLQVLEELAARWAAVAVAVSVHSLSCNPLLSFRDRRAEAALAAGMLSGDQIGAYSLSGTAGRLGCRRRRCAAVPSGDGYVVNGSKSWITHGGRADFYNLFARTGEGPGVSCF